MWQPVLEPSVWLRADAVFKSSSEDEDSDGGRWRKYAPCRRRGRCMCWASRCSCRLTSFRHLGVFPEQLPHWQWMLERLQGAAWRARRASSTCLPTRAPRR